ncbi:hypothetical protein Dsin_024265 [Dipteronia sinensis]|uniref:OTU domain-containing protein n=1 Tax=Dipteronia sinensis TaxID=43782 RepID=A0AAD9ZTP3_9ROSI|nr:hypothetical protein Dsin_024265 [Dipteronia sinensis]
MIHLLVVIHLCSSMYYPQGNHSPSLMSLSTNPMHSKRREKLKEVKSETVKHIAFIDSFSLGLRPCIRDVKDVLDDGNCGFRVMASWMDMGDDNWIQVRRDFIDELQQHYDSYAQLFGYHDRAQEVMNSLSYFVANPGIDCWMTMPDTGSPMPPIASNWLKYRYPCAEG